MIIHELTRSEAHPAYQELEVSNGTRQYAFLRSMVVAALALQRPFLSHTLLKALNFHAIACLHTHAGEYRPCPVTVGTYVPPESYRIQALMDDFVNEVNRLWESSDALVLATFVLWKLNHIHPFINGNGRTARAACYFVLCVKLNGWLRGDPILPEALRQNRNEYVSALQAVDATLAAGGLDLSALHNVLERLLEKQLNAADVPLASG